MTPGNPGNPGQKPGALPPHLASASQLQLLQERVGAQFGAFGGAAPDEVEVDQRVLADSFFKPTLKVVLSVVLGSLFLFFVSHPAFDGPGAWATSFRLDMVFVLGWVPLLWFVMARQRLEKSLRIYLVLALVIEAFSEVMFRERGDGYWDSIMWPAAVGFYGTIKELTGVPGASLPVFFFVTLGLLYRAVYGKKRADRSPPPRFAKNALVVFLATVIGLAALGLSHGGQVEWTFRQTIHLLQLPLVGLLFLYALRVPEDLAAVGTAFVVAAVFRSLLVVYVYVFVCMANGITDIPGKPEWCTNHSDSVLFVTAILILLCHANEQRSRRAIVRAVGLGALILVGIILNNRRLALVSLAAAPLILYLAMKPSKNKRRLTAALVISVPLLFGYLLVGADSASGSAFFKPAKLVVSVLDQKDNSSISRDIENENLIYTLRQSPIITKGFGHEYEYSPSNPPVDLSDVFKNFRLIAHNGVLWLWSLAGVAGFTLLWIVYPLAGTLALRGYRVAHTPLERSAALASLGAIVVCVLQIWGDQGFSSYMTLVTFGVANATAARLAVRTPII